MSFILHIDSAVQSASVCLSENERPLDVSVNNKTKDHASWLHPAIKDLVHKNDLALSDLDAIAVSNGPGSYTGLRVGMATAKGLCFALNLPLLTINTLKIMAAAAKGESDALLCPMIDARRMEVFTAVFDKDLKELVAPASLILNEHSFQELLDSHKMIFFGNGSVKFREWSKNPNAFFKESNFTAEDMVFLSYDSFLKREFADLAYSEPFYGKEFYSTAR